MVTVQSFTVSGFSIVRYSVKPVPTFPSAKYQVLLTGPVAVGDGVPVGEGDGLGDAEGDGVGDGVSVGDGVEDGVIVGDTVGDGVTLGDGLGVGLLPVIVKLFVYVPPCIGTYCAVNLVAERVK
jgi:hypothetical protein